MSKIRIHTTLENDQVNHFSGIGLYVENKIIYQENDVHVSVLFETDKVEIRRKAVDYELFLLFELNQRKQGKYELYRVGSLDVATKMIHLTLSEREIEIEYQLWIGKENMGISKFTITYEVLE